MTTTPQHTSGTQEILQISERPNTLLSNAFFYALRNQDIAFFITLHQEPYLLMLCPCINFKIRNQDMYIISVPISKSHIR